MTDHQFGSFGGFERIAGYLKFVGPLLTEIEPVCGPVWLVAQRELRTRRRIGLVFDMLAGALLER